MSFILDALRKSETDRQQQGTSEFAGVPTGTAPTAVPRWLWVVGLLLAINLAVLVGLLIKPEAGPPLRTQAVVPDKLASDAPAGEESEADFAERAAVVRQNQPPQRQKQASLPAENKAVETVESVLISQDPEAVPASSLYPTFQEIRARGSSKLADLHVDIHVYAVESENRFVFINMSKLREGEQLKEGPVVAEITPDGVVLDHAGQFFLLPRE